MKKYNLNKMRTWPDEQDVLLYIKQTLKILEDTTNSLSVVAKEIVRQYGDKGEAIQAYLVEISQKAKDRSKDTE